LLFFLSVFFIKKTHNSSLFVSIYCLKYWFDKIVLFEMQHHSIVVAFSLAFTCFVGVSSLEDRRVASTITTGSIVYETFKSGTNCSTPSFSNGDVLGECSVYSGSGSSVIYSGCTTNNDGTITYTKNIYNVQNCEGPVDRTYTYTKNMSCTEDKLYYCSPNVRTWEDISYVSWHQE
jgi:hypothetical protein